MAKRRDDLQLEVPLQLGPFVKAVQTRLEELPHEVLKANLLAHARTLEAPARAGFLEILDSSSKAQPGSVAEDLLNRIGDFVQAIEDGEYDIRSWEDEWDDRWGDSWGDDTWIGTMEELFAEAGDAFLQKNYRLAAAAYGQLLKAFHIGDEDEGDAPWDRIETELIEAKARYLRAVYEVTGPEDRAEQLVAEFRSLCLIGDPFSGIGTISDADEGALTDLDSFLSDWIEVLKDEASNVRDIWGWKEVRRLLLREAAELSGGAEGLAQLAREEGDHHPGAYTAWVAALARSGDLRAAIAAAQEGVERVSQPSPRADQADQLAELASLAGDATVALDARRQAWRSAPSFQRLLALCTEGAPSGDQLDKRMVVEFVELKRRGRPGKKQLTALLALLAGAYDSAIQRLARADPLGWSLDHPGHVVFPFFIFAAGDQGAPDPGTSMEHLWLSFPTSVRYVVLSTASMHWDGEDFRRLAEPNILEGFRPLLEGVLERHPPSAKKRGTFLEVTRKVATRRTRAIVSGKHRRSYQKTARLVIACAEIYTLVDEAGKGRAMIEDLLGEFPRHYAFRREMEALIRASPLLMSPPRASKTGRTWKT